ncbi:uncharacterized protein LOC122935141 [Bufo gargarizans]|uniref:uncharacterized protein LOC122935141 n=1 Tax=Bufo gargarizans TaxID=30331 RepID=UPI001CF538DE|nr:uncharacterized protein LOC122935141 [Bufo gargarizans]
MPACIVTKCRNKSGRRGQSPHIIMHYFPNDIDRVVLWLAQTGQKFADINGVAKKIAEGRKSNKYVICSDHFAEDCYKNTHYGRVLNKDAVPTIFPDVVDGESIIEETLKKPTGHSRKRVRDPDLPTTSLCENISPGEPILPEIVKYGMCSVSTQTDYNLTNSRVYLLSTSQSLNEAQLSTQQEQCLLNPNMSTPLHQGVRRVLESSPGFSSPLKKKINLDFELLDPDSNIMSKIYPLSPILTTNLEQPEVNEDEISINVDESLQNESEYLPGISSLDDSENFMCEPLVLEKKILIHAGNFFAQKTWSTIKN